MINLIFNILFISNRKSIKSNVKECVNCIVTISVIYFNILKNKNCLSVYVLSLIFMCLFVYFLFI